MVGSWNLLEKFAPVHLDNFLSGHFSKLTNKKVIAENQYKKIEFLEEFEYLCLWKWSVDVLFEVVAVWLSIAVIVR